jgi:outer membrane receptor protein involved in Fe transport
MRHGQVDYGAIRPKSNSEWLPRIERRLHIFNKDLRGDEMPLPEHAFRQRNEGPECGKDLRAKYSRVHNARLPGLCLMQWLMILLIGIVIATGSQAYAQVRFGTVVGFVSDPTGASMVGATVILTNLGTSEARTMRTGSAGTYAFANVPAGEYQVVIDQNGFKRFTAQNIHVDVDVTTRVDAKLQLGSSSETVQVNAGAVTLQTDSSSLGSVVSEQTVQNMPVSGRNVNNLLTLVPGVTAGGSTYGTASGNQAGGARTNSIAFGNYFIGGAFGNQSAFFVDGVSSNGPANNANGLIPSQDVVQEFRVVTNNVSAEYGNYAGGVVNITTKSGTNTFHGTAYDYLRNTILNANDFFSNHADLKRAPLIQNQFGGTVGGPIKHDKTFFFFGYEGLRTHSAVLSTTTVPTAAELTGDFSDPALPPIYDHSQPGNPQFSCAGRLNVICPSRIDQSAKLILADTFPAPNQPGLVNNYITNFPTGAVQNQYNGRVDQNFGSKDLLFGRYTYWKVISNPYDAWGTHTQGQGATGLFNQEAVLGNTYTFNPTTLLDLRASYLRIFQTEAPDSTNINLGKYQGNYGALQAQILGGPQHGAGSIPSSSFTGTTGFPATNITSSNGIGSQLYWHQNVYAFSGNLIKTLGKHQLKIGGNVRRVQWISDSDTSGITLTYNSEATASIAAPGATGIALASNLLGIPQRTNVGNVGGSRAYYTNYGFFVEDTYQVSRQLTATLGLRWDQPSVYSEANNRDTVFLPGSSAQIGGVTSFTNPVTGASQQTSGLLALVDSPAWHSQREDYLHWKLFAPRVGLAYRVDAETVVRAGYGLSYLPISLSQDGPNFSPINTITTAINNSFQVTTGQPDQIVATTANPFPQGILQPPGRSANLASYYGSTVVSRVPGDKAAYQQQWNLAFERQLGRDGTLTLAYAGSKGTHLLLQGFATASNININQLPDQYFALGAIELQKQVPNPFYGAITNPTSPLSQPMVARGYLLKPFPQYDRVLAVDPHRGFSSYNSLQVALNKRIWGGGQVVAAYTWSKLMANTDNITSFLDPTSIFSGQIQNNDSVTKTERSVSAYDIPHNVTFGYTIPLPFGRDRRFLRDAGPILSRIVGGWTLNGLTTIHSGAPLGLIQFESPIMQQFGAGNGFIFAPGVYIRPNVVPGCSKSVSGSRYQRALTGWFNTACFTNTSSPTEFGNAPRVDSGIRIDGRDNWDLALWKETPISEIASLRFTAQAYNLFNRAQFSGPNPLVGSPGVTGIVTSTSAPPRNIEFSLRLTF